MGSCGGLPPRCRNVRRALALYKIKNRLPCRLARITTVAKVAHKVRIAYRILSKHGGRHSQRGYVGFDPLQQFGACKHVPIMVGPFLSSQEASSYATAEQAPARPLPMGGRTIIQARIDAGQADMADLSRKSGRNAAYIQQFLKRNVPAELPEEVRIALAPHLGVDPDALREGPRAVFAPRVAIFGAGSDVQLAPSAPLPEPRRLSVAARCEVLGVVEAGLDGQFVVNLSDGPLEYVDLPAALADVPDLFALFVSGESMAGVWMPGDTVYVSRRRPVTPDAYVVVLVETGPGQPPAAFLKQYIGRNNGKLKLRQYNPAMTLEIDMGQVRHMWRALHWREWAT